MASNLPVGPLGGGGAPTPGSDIWSLIPGGDTLHAFLTMLDTIIGDVGSALELASSAHPLAIAQTIGMWIQSAPKALIFLSKPEWQWVVDNTIGGFYKAFLEGGVGVDVDKFDASGQKSVQTVDSVLGFALVCNFIGAAIDITGKGLLGGRWGEAASDIFQELMQETGINWAMGMEIERAFEAGVGTAIEENILALKTPKAPEWPLVRTMLKQHVVDEKTLKERFAAFGFSPDWTEKLLKVIDVPIPMGDLQNLYLHDLMTPGEVVTGLKALGFNDDQATLLRTLYVDNVETETSRSYAATARQLFANYLMSEADYVAILKAVNYPSKMIADDLAAIKLEHDTGRLNLSMAAIKAEYVRGNHDANQATTELLRTGLTPDAITELIHTWDLPAQKHEHGMSASKVLSYFVSGLMTEADARARLLDTGLKPADVDFLLANPTAKPGVRVRPRTPGFIVTAYVDGAVMQDQLSALFTSAGVAPDDLDKWLAIATYRYAHRKPTSATGKPLTDSDIREAFKNGIFDPHTAIADLVANGWSTENATVLLEITNKGQPLTPPAGPFATLQQAIAFLQGLGYAIIGPPDPRIGAAEGMIIAAGYSYIQPSTPGEVVGSGTGGTPIGPVTGP